MEASRRKMGTYGKSNRRVLVHDLFNVAQKEPSLYETLRAPATVNVASSGASTPFSEVSEDPGASQPLRQELSAFADASSAHLSRNTPRSKSATPADASSPSLFDLDSSSDDMKSEPTADSTKRRKLVLKSSNLLTRNETSATSSPSAAPLYVPQSKSPAKRGNGKSRPKARPAPKTKASRKGISASVKQTTSAVSAEGALNAYPSDHPSPLNSSQETPPELASPHSENSVGSMKSTRSTPKRKRHVEDDLASDTSSPSQIELSSLRLTPNRQSAFRASSKDSRGSKSISRTPSKSRARLVDRLDSPTNPAAHDISVTDTSPRPRKSTKPLSPPKQPLSDREQFDKHEILPRSHLKRDDRGVSDAPATRARTYGKQRSHLKDMTSELENQDQSFGQHSLQDLVSQVEALTAAKPQFEIEDESDEEDTGPKLKSIHELRHAGLANRFDRDLEVLLEDIESGIRSLRIQALMSLVRKLQENSFKVHVLVSGKLGRLVDVATPDLDLSSSTILVLGLWALAVAETATAQALAEIYGCLLMLPPALIVEERAMSEIAKGRTEDLSKALMRDMTDFEQHVLRKSVKQEGQADHIIVSRVFLRCLELTMRRITALAGHTTSPPTSLLEGVLDCIKHNLQKIADHGERPELIESIRLLVSWLERASIDIGGTMPPHVLEHLGTTLSEIVRWSKSEHAEIEQSAIKCAIEMSNGDPATCLRFAATPLLPIVFVVVQEHFSHLAADEREVVIEEEKLNSAILALGCLLHFADSSDQVRKTMANVDGTKDSQVTKLVNIFNVFVDEVGEATTEERTQALGVPFGYLCLLLCTLCLDASIRSHISSTIKGDGLTRLWMEAETCLNHMKQIDQDSFVERFSTAPNVLKEDITV